MFFNLHNSFQADKTTLAFCSWIIPAEKIIFWTTMSIFPAGAIIKCQNYIAEGFSSSILMQTHTCLGTPWESRLALISVLTLTPGVSISYCNSNGSQHRDVVRLHVWGSQLNSIILFNLFNFLDSELIQRNKLWTFHCIKRKLIQTDQTDSAKKIMNFSLYQTQRFFIISRCIIRLEIQFQTCLYNYVHLQIATTEEFWKCVLHFDLIDSFMLHLYCESCAAVKRWIRNYLLTYLSM